jgi:CRP-like cAMP-binding protein
MLNTSLDSFLDRLDGRDQHLAAASTLFHQGDPVRHIYRVCSGEIVLQRFGKQGSMLTFQRASTGQVLAEASLHSQHYHCAAIASTGSMVIEYRKSELLGQMRSEPAFALAWNKYLSHQIQLTRQRMEILSLRTVAERLNAWMLLNGESLPVKGNWQAIAREIAVTPEALYREIARRR